MAGRRSGPRDWQPTGPNSRVNALSKYLGIPRDQIKPPSGGIGNIYLAEGEEYRVLTDQEADMDAADYIEDSLWTFDPDFIVEHTDLPAEAEDMIAMFVDKKEYKANSTIKALINDWPKFVADAIKSFGRGTWLSSYDGGEDEQNGFFIYRVN